MDGWPARGVASHVSEINFASHVSGRVLTQIGMRDPEFDGQLVAACFVGGHRSHLVIWLSLPVQLVIQFIRALPLFSLYPTLLSVMFTPSSRPSSPQPKAPSPPRPSPPFPYSHYAPFRHLGTPRPQEQEAAKIILAEWYEPGPAQGRMGRKEGCGGHRSTGLLPLRPWLRGCQPTQ